jgi:hypothetical protein
MSKIYSPKIVTDSLVMCLDASQNKSYPTDLPVKNGLVMWMDAADDTTFSYSSGTTVTQWRDKSGLNNHCVPLTAGPTRSSFLNSRKVLAFTTGQSIGSLSFTMETSAYTIFGVTRLTGTTNSRVLTAYYNNWLLGHWGGLVNPYYAEGWVYYPPNSADTIWRIHMGDWGGPSNDLAATYSNGTVLTSGSTAAAAGPKGLGINFQGGEPSTCEAAEIIVFNRVLSTVERRLVHTYLGQKWGISNTDRSIVDLAGNDDNGLFGGGTDANMPVYDFYNKGSLRFDGLNDTININNSQLNISTSITVEAWVKYNAQGGATAKTYSVITYKSGWGWLLEDQSGQFNFRISTSVTADSNVNSSYSHGLNTWNHVVGTYDGTSQKIYVDGILKNSTSLTGTINVAGNTVRLGNYEGDYNLTGNIGVVRVYNKALSAAEVAQNYEAQKSKFANTIVQQGLVLNLDAGNPYSYAGAGTIWYDVSGNSFNATLNNSPTYTTDNGGVLNWISASSQYATVSMSSTLRVANITQEAWVYLSTTADQVFIGSQYGTSSNNSFALWVSGGTFYFGVNTGGSFYNSASSAPSTSTWYHLVHTYNGTTQYLYINGVLVTTYNSAASGNISYDTSNTLLAIGADFNGTGYNVGPSLYVNGKMPVIRIYNTALSAAQVLQNYNATKGRFGL